MTDHVTVHPDIEFASPDGQPLLLDLYRPAGEEPVPVVVHVHGGGWARGDRAMGAETRLSALAALGVAVASVDYRLVPAVQFPANLLDVRAAVGFLRREGAQWNLGTDRIGVWGASAGGHLALSCAYAADPPADDERVDAIVNWFGASDVAALAVRSPLERMTRPTGAEGMLLGVDDPAAALAEARAASPIEHVRADGPPVLTMHGDRDQMIPMNLSVRLHDALTRLGVDSTLVVLGGVGHEHPAFERREVLGYVAEWLRARL